MITCAVCAADHGNSPFDLTDVDWRALGRGDFHNISRGETSTWEPMSASLVMKIEQNQRISAVFAREASRLGRFIRGRVPDADVAEDILQDVFSELIEAERLVQPIEQVSAWLFRVARNRITDWFRRKKPESRASEHDEHETSWEDALPSLDAGPDALYARATLLEELVRVIDELPEPQRVVFVAHEIEGLSFRQIAIQSGESVNTLLSRKHTAVQYLRRRLQTAHDNLDID
jgi:RNA polymerase sigma factor (sigma-70 family)